MRRKKNDQNSVIWVLDECVRQDKRKWDMSNRYSVTSIKDLGLLGAKDKMISDKLREIYPNKKFIIVTSNTHKDKSGDYFTINDDLGVVSFGSSITYFPEDQKKCLKKFQKNLKNLDKLVGARTSLSKFNISYKKGSKSKTLNYDNYI